jgi:PST family polysaccharide transporter
MRQWGFLGSAIIVAAIFVGLPWGAVGVAASYALTDLVVRTPLLFWYVGRRGPVRGFDLCVGPLPGVVAALATLVALWVFRRLFPEVGGVAGLCMGAVIALIATLCAVAVTARGRAAVADGMTLAMAVWRAAPDGATAVGIGDRGRSLTGR